MPEPLNIETRAGQPVQHGEYTLTPFAHVWQLRIPGIPAALTWNRPASVHVMHTDGEEQVLPIHDVTRYAIWALLAASLGVFLISMISNRNKSRN